VCLAIPALIVEKNENWAKADIGGVVRDINLDLVDRPADIGDYVLVHAGFAIRKLDKEDAEETLRLMREVLK
jgi:hydrogenase expression/formation protein HypC